MLMCLCVYSAINYFTVKYYLISLLMACGDEFTGWLTMHEVTDLESQFKILSLNKFNSASDKDSEYRDTRGMP